MGFLDSILGSDSDVEYEQMDLLSREQKDLLNNYLLPFLKNSFDEPGPAFMPSGGVLAPGLTSGQMTSLAALEQQALGGNSGLQDAKGTLSKIIRSGDSGSGDFENFYQSSILDPALKDFSEKVQPAIGRKYAESGFFSNERRRADETAGANLMDSLHRQRTGLALGAREQALQAMGLLPSFDALERAPYWDVLRAGEYSRGVDRELIEAERQEFLRRFVDQPDKRIAQVLAALGLNTFQNFASVTPGNEGLLAGILQGASQGASGAAVAAALSDRRVKRILARVGRTTRGIPTYLFRYLWSPVVHLGVIAQECPADCVISLDGILAVDYKKVGDI